MHCQVHGKSEKCSCWADLLSLGLFNSLLDTLLRIRILVQNGLLLLAPLDDLLLQLRTTFSELIVPLFKDLVCLFLSFEETKQVLLPKGVVGLRLVQRVSCVPWILELRIAWLRKGRLIKFCKVLFIQRWWWVFLLRLVVCGHVCVKLLGNIRPFLAFFILLATGDIPHLFGCRKELRLFFVVSLSEFPANLSCQLNRFLWKR